jgi:hypothetical protein
VRGVSEWLAEVRRRPSGWRFFQADQDVQVEEFFQQRSQVAAFDDFDSPVRRGEVAARLSDPGGGDEDTVGCAFVVHDAGEGVYRLEADDLPVALGLDDAQAPDDGVFVDGDPVDAFVLRCYTAKDPRAQWQAVSSRRAANAGAPG